MNTLKEQRMISAHQLGMRDCREGRRMLIPVYLESESELATAYRAGYLGEKRRAELRAISGARGTISE